MNKLVNKLVNKLLMSMVLLFSIMVAQAADGPRYLCKSGDGQVTREVKVHYLGEAKVPCEVHYIKNGASPEVKWNAEAEEGYCEARAKEFSEKLGTLGYPCELQSENAVHSQ